MTEEKKMTALESPVGADEKQPLHLITTVSLADADEDFNDEFSEEDDAELTASMLDPYYLRTISLSGLYESTYPARPPVIENLLYPGTYLFAGAPKVGKSFLVAQIGYHVSAGLPLWEREVRKGTVLYLALEDDYPRLQGRMSRMFGVEGADNFYFAIAAMRLNDGLDKQLEQFIRKHPDTRLIIIDTLQKVREASSEKYSYANDYEIIARLKKLTDQCSISIIIVHHTRKQEADDRFDTISGTNGLLGAADGAFILQKEKRTDNAALLDVVGRDQQDQRLRLSFDREYCTWQLTGVETELWKDPPDTLLESISRLVNADIPAWTGSASMLSEALHTDLPANVLSRRLNVGTGRLYSEYGIRYECRRTHGGRRITLTLTTEA